MEFSKERCPCQSQEVAYASCCKPYHEGSQCPDALALMRSRYSAYVLRNEAYLRKTWHVSTCPKKILESDASQVTWQGLEILAFENLSDEEARVEFIARFSQGGKLHKLHELSYFIRDQEQWLYVDGQMKA